MLNFSQGFSRTTVFTYQIMYSLELKRWNWKKKKTNNTHDLPLYKCFFFIPIQSTSTAISDLRSSNSYTPKLSSPVLSLIFCKAVPMTDKDQDSSPGWRVWWFPARYLGGFFFQTELIWRQLQLTAIIKIRNYHCQLFKLREILTSWENLDKDHT